MSKRRNPKKEKALRNQAYARRFRKRRATGHRFMKRRDRNEEAESNNLDESTSTTGAAG